MDTEQLVYAYTLRERNKIDTLFQNRTLTEYKKQAYQGFNLSISKFTNTYLSSLGGETSLRTPTQYNFSSASVSANGAGKITATTQAGAELATTNIVAAKVATSASVSSSAYDPTSTAGVKRSTSISSIIPAGGSLAADENGNYKMTFVNKDGAAKDITFKADGTVNDFIKAFNGANLGAKLVMDDIRGSFTLEASTGGADSTDNLNDFIANNLNARTDITGATNDNEIAFLNALGFASGDAVTSGTNATITFKQSDGSTIEKEITNGGNSISLNGVNYTVQSSFTMTGSETISVAANKDYSTFINKVKDMVSELNKLYADIYTAVNMRERRDYKPLTDEQKSAMKDSDIANWEAIVKGQTLSRDPYMQKLANNIRNIFNTKIEGSNLTFAQIGIAPGPYAVGKPTEFVVDEAKLAKAIEQDPDSVTRMFLGGRATSTAGATTGIIEQLDKMFISHTGTITSTVIANKLDPSINNFDRDIKIGKTRLAEREDYYYSQLAKMEAALSKMQSQSSWIGSQMGGGQ